MNIEDEIIKGLLELETYFKRNIKNDNSFKAEFEAAKKINDILKEDFIDFEKIKQIIEDTESRKYYGGSGWHELKHRLYSLANHLNKDVKNWFFPFK